MVCIAVCAVADDSPKSDVTGPVAEGVCSIGIFMCVLCVNVYSSGGTLGGFETAKCLPCVGLLGLFYAASSAGGVWDVSIIYIFLATWI